MKNRLNQFAVALAFTLHCGCSTLDFEEIQPEGQTKMTTSINSELIDDSNHFYEVAGENLGRKFGYSKMKILKNIFSTLKTIILIKIN